MALENEILGIDWHEQGAKVYGFSRREALAYRTLGVILGIVFLMSFFLFPLVALVSLPLALYMGYLYWKIKQGRPFAYLVEIDSKECWFKDGKSISGSDDTEGSDNSFYYYLLHVRISKKWDILEDRILSSSLPSLTNLIVRLDHPLFGQFEKGTEAFFVFSPANDLIGYWKNHGLVLLNRSVRYSDGSVSNGSTSIPQELTYPPKEGFELMSNVP